MPEKSRQNDELLSVSVKRLFGQHNHTINLKPNGMTLIHGPNGVGKTSMLKLIGHAIRLDVNELAKTVFDNLELTFSDEQRLTISRIPIEEGSKQELLFDDSEFVALEELAHAMHFEFAGRNRTKHELTLTSDTPPDEKRSRPRQIAQIQESRPWLSRVGQDQWLDERTGEVFSTSDLLESDVFLLGRKDRMRRDEFKKHIPEIPVETIESQRLVVTRPRENIHPRHRQMREHTNAVVLHAEGMSEQIRHTFHMSANVSQDLDRTFAHRVLTSDEAIRQSEENLRETYEKQLGTWQRIKDAGMLPEFDSRRVSRMYRYPQTQALDQLTLPDELDVTQRRVLSFYVADTEQKLNPYQDLLGKVELFLSIVNSRFDYSGKELRCDASDGFRVLSQSGRRVPLDALSSGEQHEIVLNYQLIFGVPENSLVLIDEPEISLHVDWQREFIDQILNIAEVRGHKFIIATHSPQIIDEHWENTEVLRGSSEQEKDDYSK